MRFALAAVLLFPRTGWSSRRNDAALTAALALPAGVVVAADRWLRRRRSDRGAPSVRAGR